MRKENERIVEDADAPKVSLLWLNEVDLPRAVDQGVRIALVDHNHATFRFGHASVTAVIDHHADEHLYKDAVPRVVTQGIGSCSSLVTTHYSNFWTDEQDDHSPTSSSLRSSLANLLSDSILIDTVNLKRVPGKASDTDYAAYRLLLPHLSHPSLQSYTIASETEQSQPPTERFDLLFTLKSDVTSLTSRDLLRRDYKSFTTESNHRKAGLSTVVRSLTDQGGNQWPVALAAWAEEEDLDVAMILTSFETTKKHKRRKEIAALIPRARENVEVVRAIFERFPEAFVEKSPLEPWTEEEMASLSGVPEGCEVRVWKQIETTPTRKQVAPAIVSVLGEVPARSSQ